MPLVLLLVAIGVVAIGVRGQSAEAGKLLASEFAGANSFIPWFLAIMLVGVIGYWKPAKPFSDAFLGLIVLALLLAQGTGFFSRLNEAFTSATPSAKGSAAGAASGSQAGSMAGGALGGDTAGNGAGAALGGALAGARNALSTGVSLLQGSMV